MRRIDEIEAFLYSSPDGDDKETAASDKPAANKVRGSGRSRG